MSGGVGFPLSDGVLQWQISTRRIVLGNQLQRATALWLPEPRRVEKASFYFISEVRGHLCNPCHSSSRIQFLEFLCSCGRSVQAVTLARTFFSMPVNQDLLLFLLLVMTEGEGGSDCGAERGRNGVQVRS